MGDDDDPFRQARKFRHGPLDAFNDQRPRSASHDLLGAEAMYVGVVPVQARRFLRWNAEFVFEGRIGWLDRCLQDFVLVAFCRYREAMKMQIGGGGRHRTTAAAIVAGMSEAD